MVAQENQGLVQTVRSCLSFQRANQRVGNEGAGSEALQELVDVAEDPVSLSGKSTSCLLLQFDLVSIES